MIMLPFASYILGFVDYGLMFDLPRLHITTILECVTIVVDHTLALVHHVNLG